MKYSPNLFVLMRLGGPMNLGWLATPLSPSLHSYCPNFTCPKSLVLLLLQSLLLPHSIPIHNKILDYINMFLKNDV